MIRQVYPQAVGELYRKSIRAALTRMLFVSEIMKGLMKGLH